MTNTLRTAFARIILEVFLVYCSCSQPGVREKSHCNYIKSFFSLENILASHKIFYLLFLNSYGVRDFLIFWLGVREHKKIGNCLSYHVIGTISPKNSKQLKYAIFATNVNNSTNVGETECGANSAIRQVPLRFMPFVWLN